MGLFGKKNIKNLRTGRGGNWSVPGTHEVVITRISNKTGEDFKGFKGESVAVEYEIVSSDNPDAQPGEQKSWVNNITNHGDMALGNIADFIRASLQTLAAEAGELYETPEEIDDFDEDDEARIIPPPDSEETSEIIGHRMKLYCFVKKTEKKKGDFTVHNWSAPDDLIESLKEAA